MRCLRKLQISNEAAGFTKWVISLGFWEMKIMGFSNTAVP